MWKRLPKLTNPIRRGLLTSQ